MVEPKSTSSAVNKKAVNAEIALPASRIRTIMKSSLDTGQISNEVIFLMAKSTEYFIQYLTSESYKHVQGGGNQLKYEHLAEHVQNEENLEFLLQILPKKIKVRDFKEMLKQQDEESSEESSSESE